MADKKISDLTAASSVAGTDVVPVVQTAGGADDPKKATVTQVLAPHAGNTSNPHAVTKTQVGLGNVQNVDQTNADNLTSGTVADARIAPTIARDSEVSAAVSAEASARDTAIALAIANLIASAPGALDTLNELATALGNDPNFATTMTNALAGKQPLDPDLTAIAALAPADDAIIQRASGIWVAHTPAQVKATLALTKGDVGLGNVDNTADASKPVSTAQAAADAAVQAFAIARANHTGTQLLATISDAGALASRATVGTTQIDDDAVTNAKLANMANATIKGRTTAGTGDPEDLSASQGRTVLGLGAAALLADPIPVANGGTAGGTAQAARDNLGVATWASAQVTAAETTTSTTYVDLTTPGPSVTITVPASGKVILTWGGLQQNSGAGGTFSAIAVSGASTITPTTNEAIAILYNAAGAGIGFEASRTFVLTGLTPGSTTFKVQYRVNSGTGTFARRHLLVGTLP